MATTPRILDVSFIVYRISNIINNKSYIGITSKTLKERIKGHMDDVHKGSQCPIHRAIRKYGINNFRIEEIDNSAKTWGELCNKEKYFIDLYNSFNIGYNATLGGDGKYGCSPSVETRQKISESMKGKNTYKHTKEHIDKHRKAMTGKKHSEETKEKMRKIKKGRKPSVKCLSRTKETWTGRSHTEESKRKMSETKSFKKTYWFVNNSLGVLEYCTRIELCRYYNLKNYDTCRLVNKTRKQVKGWEVVLSE